MFPYKIKRQNVVVNIPFVENSTIQQVNIPTDLPIAKIDITLAGTPTGVVNVTPPTLQDTFGVPALARALGKVTLNGKSGDGTQGFSLNNIPAWLLFWDAWTKTQQKPSNVDFTAATPATACKVTVPIMFLDPTLPEEESILTALEAQRFAGGANALTLSLETGGLNAAAVAFDRTVSVGGAFTTPVGVGTLKISVTVYQIVPLGWTWPEWNGPNAMPMFDRDWEYLPQGQLVQPAATNGLQFARRGVQVSSFFFNSSQATTTLAETGVNNLGSDPSPYLTQKLGGNIQQQVDPNTVQSILLDEFFFAQSSAPTGTYGMLDWKESLDAAYSLSKAGGALAWDLNAGATPGGAASQAVRSLHLTLNASAAGAKKFPQLA